PGQFRTSSPATPSCSRCAGGSSSASTTSSCSVPPDRAHQHPAVRRSGHDNVGRVSRRMPPTRQDLIRWAEALSGIARTGLGFTQNLYERERFEEVMAVAGDIRAAARADEEFDAEHYVEEWMKGVGHGVAGYVTPKVAVGAVVYNDNGE